MKNSPFIAYLKSIFLKKIGWRGIFLAIYIFAYFIIFLARWNNLITEIYMAISLFIIVLIFLSALFIDMISSHYKWFKNHDFPKTHLPENIESLDSKVSPDIYLIVKQMDERIRTLEDNLSSFRISLYAIFTSVGVGVVLLLIVVVIQALSHPK
jgi:predicted PurR-regulated permease PerM